MISCGTDHSIALTDSGRVFGWGRNECGQLGGREEKLWPKPKLIELNNNQIKKIICGSRYSAVLFENGDVHVFGKLNEKSYISVVIESESHGIKFKDIESSFKWSDFVLLSEKDVLYFWKTIGEHEIDLIKIENRKSFDELFSMNFKPVEEIMEFDGLFLLNNYYVENFNQIEKLGSGSFGTVYKAVHKWSDLELAFKKIKFKMENINEILTEFINYSVVKDLNQDFVVIHYSSWFERSVDNKDGKLIFFIGMELCDKTLDEIIAELHKKFLFNEILNPIGFYLASLLFIELVEGVNYLHNHNPVLIHRDLKPANILLKVDSNNQRFVKIADFGLMALHEVSEQSHTIDVGTPKYTAPGVMNNKKYDEKADIYSLGVIMQKLFNIDVN